MKYSFWLCSGVLLPLFPLTCINADDNANTQEVHVEAPQDEVAKVDQLTKATEDTLSKLKTLRGLLVQYKQCETMALKNPNDTENIVQLVMLAKQIQDIINETYLQDYFSSQFLEELKKFAQIADKKNIPPAK